MWAPCPFHQEKTASFHVDDRKGFYYCFGCHAKGDAISFRARDRECGLHGGDRDPGARGRDADARTRSAGAGKRPTGARQLAEVMEQAVQYLPPAAENRRRPAQARDYLARARAGEPRRWSDGGSDLRRTIVGHCVGHLTGKGVPLDLIVDAGLAAVPEGGGEPYDRFRGRIIFPIRDARGRAIALGGRAMDPNARAKYLNSPETELFDKGRSLYNHGPAREAAGKGQPLIVAEGYMDVIALAEAGFGATVAPLGTAITEDQLHLMWRIAPEPIIALDGDTAGLRAAMRLIDIALPLLEAGQVAAVLPDARRAGPRRRDPRRAARARCRRCWRHAQPLVRCCGSARPKARCSTAPSARRRWTRSLREAIRKIADPSLRRALRRRDQAAALGAVQPARGAEPQAGRRRQALVQGAAGGDAGRQAIGAGGDRRASRGSDARGGDPGGDPDASIAAAAVRGRSGGAGLPRARPCRLARRAAAPRARPRRTSCATKCARPSAPAALEKLFAPKPSRAWYRRSETRKMPNRPCCASPRNWPSWRPSAGRNARCTRRCRISAIWPTRG